MSNQLARIVQQLIKAETHNGRVKTKADMLMNANWRARVLRDLGGETALTRWERRAGRWRKPRDILKPDASPAQRRARAANLEKAKAANRDKLFKSGPKRKAGNDYHPNIVFDRVRVDMEGQFRLAPIMRQKITVKAQAAPNPTPPKTYAKSITYTKINPIPLWPIEFRTAEGIALSSSAPPPVPRLERGPPATECQTQEVPGQAREQEREKARDMVYETKSAPPNPVIPHVDAGPSNLPHGQSTSKARRQPPGQTAYKLPADTPMVPGQARDDIESTRIARDDIGGKAVNAKPP